MCTRPDGLVRPSRIDTSARTGPTRGLVQGHGFRRTSRGLYVASDVDSSIVEQRILEQGARLRKYGAVTGWACLRWRGAQFFDGTAPGGTQLPVPLVVGAAKLRAVPGVLVSQEQLAPSEREWVAGLWCTTTQRALFDEMRRHGQLRQAVVDMDMAAAARLISVDLMRSYVGHRSAWTGVPLVRQALRLATNESRSPQESRMRLTWLLDAGLPAPVCNRPVFDLSGQLLGVPDLFDEEAGLVGEYDGADHRESTRHRSDVARQQRFRDHGLEYFAIVAGDLRDRSAAAQRMLNTRARAKFLPPESRAWTLTRPVWSPEPESLDEQLLRLGLAADLTHR